MSDQPEFTFEVTSEEIRAALARGDYPWLCEQVFIPALAQFSREKHTAALLKSPRPRSRRMVGTGLRRGLPRCRKAAGRHSEQGDPEVPA
jgi:hypothetical protein